MRVLVTGAAGYVGRAVVEALTAAGHEPVALVHSHRNGLPGGVEVRAGDLEQPASLVQALDGIEAVCHLAGLTRARESWEHPLRYFAVNTSGTINLLAAMETVGVDRIVFSSTGSIYGAPERQPMGEDLPDDPPHPYAVSKLAAEHALEWQARAGRLSVTVLRLFNVAGRLDPDTTRIVPRVLAAARGEALRVNGDGTAVRDFLHVDDAAAAFVAALDRGPAAGDARRYNIGRGIGASVMEVVAAVEEVTGQPLSVERRPPAAEPARLICDLSRALTELAWKPRQSDLRALVRHAWEAYMGSQRI